MRWELNIRNKENVRIVVSGGLSLEDVLNLKDIVDAFGVGTSIAGAKPVDFALDIVEREGKFAAKRGKRSGMKQIYRDWEKLEDEVRLFNSRPPEGKEPIIQKYIENGEIIRNSSMESARSLALKQIEIIKNIGVEKFLF